MKEYFNISVHSPSSGLFTLHSYNGLWACIPVLCLLKVKTAGWGGEVWGVRWSFREEFEQHWEGGAGGHDGLKLIDTTWKSGWISSQLRNRRPQQSHRFSEGVVGSGRARWEQETGTQRGGSSEVNHKHNVVFQALRSVCRFCRRLTRRPSVCEWIDLSKPNSEQGEIPTL